MGLWSGELPDVRARRKIAAAIWHTPNQKLDILAMVVNLGMDSTVEAKTEAHSLCVQAVKHLGETRLIGISGTISSLHPT